MNDRNISPIANNPSTNFLDDSILFSQRSQFDPHNIANPITPTPAKKTSAFNDFMTDAKSPQGFHNTQSRENILSMIKFINHTLNSFGFSPLGDLTSTDDAEIQKTLNCVHELVQQRLKDIEFRKDIFERMAKLQNDKSMYMETIERMKQENHSLSKEIGATKNLAMRNEKKMKEEREKLVTEKDQLTKNLAKHTQKITQYQHDLRKKEVDVNKTKEQVLKRAANTNSRHSAEFLTASHSTQFKGKSSAENDLLTMVNANVDSYRNKLLLENQELRTMLYETQKELLNLFNDKKEEFIQKRMNEINKNAEVRNIRSYYEDYFADAHLQNLREGNFYMPLERKGDEIIQLSRNNLKAFGYFVDKLLKFNYTPDFFKNLSPQTQPPQIGKIPQVSGGVDQELSKMGDITGFKRISHDDTKSFIDEKQSTLKKNPSQLLHHDMDLSNILKKENLSKLDRDISGRHSPIEQKKDIDTSLYQELLQEMPNSTFENRGGGFEYTSANDIENRFNDLMNTKDKFHEEDKAPVSYKPVLQENNKWKEGHHRRISFGTSK